MSQERFGGTWWGRRWIQDLERLSTAWQNRLPRGRDYAAKGHVLTLNVTAGRIAAKVQGSRSKPYSTTIDVPANKDTDWDRLITRLAREARFPAMLLNGEMPEDIEAVFRDENLALFPTRNSELIGHCTCPDKARPCKHIAAVHFAFGEALDRDPFLLFQLRGADRDTLLRGFQREWFGHTSGHERAEQRQREADAIRGVRVIPFSADRFNRAPEAVRNMPFRVQPVEQPLLVLQRLENPRPWQLPIGTRDLLGPVYEEAARLALSLALEGVRELDEEEEEHEHDEDLFDDEDFGLDGDDGERADDDEDDDDEDEDDDDEMDSDDDPPPENSEQSPARESRPSGDFVALRRQPTPAGGSAVARTAPAPAAQSPVPSRDTPASRPPPRSGDVLSSMLGDAIPRPPRRRKETGDDPAASAPTSEPSVLIRRGTGERGKNVKRKNRRSTSSAPRPTAVRVAGAYEDTHDDATATEDATTAALELLADGQLAEAFPLARTAWKHTGDIPRLLLLLNTAEDEPDALADETVALKRTAAVRPLQLTGAQLIFLLLTDAIPTATEAINERVEKGLDQGDHGADLFSRAALRLLLAGRQTPEGSSLCALLHSLDGIPDVLADTLGDDAESAGLWLDRVALTRVDDQHREALADAACNAVLGLLEAASPRMEREDADQLAALATAIAEGLSLAEDHRRLSLFLHRSHTSATGRTGLALRSLLDDSPILPAGLVVDD